jgi:hypothetical protein
MTKEQRLRMIFWGVFGFLGLIRAAYGVAHQDALGLVLGVLWCAFGGWKAWSEAKKVDEENLGRAPRQKQPDRPRKAKRR